jgi:hypothetical protein
MGVALGRTDYEVGHAIGGMKDALNAMLDATTATGERGTEIDRLVQDDLNVSLSLSPKKIEDEFERLRRAAFKATEDPESVVWVDEAIHKLDEWHGPAADAFRRHLGRIKTFITESQNQAVLNGLQALGALFLLAYQMRQQYYDMARVVTSCANYEIDQQRTREEKLELSITKEFVLAVLSMNPAGAVDAGLEFFVEAGAALGDYSLEGTGADAVIDQYRDRSTGLRQTFEHNLNLVTHKLNGQWRSQVENEAKLVVMHPLPSYMDVSSPDFDYTKFWTEEYPPNGPFSQQVTDQQGRYAQEEKAEETEINRRMEGQAQ